MLFLFFYFLFLNLTCLGWNKTQNDYVSQCVETVFSEHVVQMCYCALAHLTSMWGISFNGLSAKYAYNALKTACTKPKIEGKLLICSWFIMFCREIFAHKFLHGLYLKDLKKVSKVGRLTWWATTTTGARWRSSSMITGSNLHYIENLNI